MGGTIGIMEPAFILFMIAAGFWSIITSFVAIIRILRNKFNGDRLTWIMISMIAFIGPVLWLVNGRKLIVRG